MKGGRYLPPHRKRLAEDLLDKAEGRETDSLKDALIRLARQKKSGSIVLDGRKSISKRPMVNFLGDDEHRCHPARIQGQERRKGAR